MSVTYLVPLNIFPMNPSWQKSMTNQSDLELKHIWTIFYLEIILFKLLREIAKVHKKVSANKFLESWIPTVNQKFTKTDNWIFDQIDTWQQFYNKYWKLNNRSDWKKLTAAHLLSLRAVFSAAKSNLKRKIEFISMKSKINIWRGLLWDMHFGLVQSNDYKIQCMTATIQVKVVTVKLIHSVFK